MGVLSRSQNTVERIAQKYTFYPYAAAVYHCDHLINEVDGEQHYVNGALNFPDDVESSSFLKGRRAIMNKGQLSENHCDSRDSILALQAVLRSSYRA